MQWVVLILKSEKLRKSGKLSMFSFVLVYGNEDNVGVSVVETLNMKNREDVK